MISKRVAAYRASVMHHAVELCAIGSLLIGPSMLFAQGGNGQLEMATGYGIAGAFQHAPYDSVNEYNGQLNITIPLGPTFKAGTIEYGLTAAYNSRIWEWNSRCLRNDTGQCTSYYDQSFESMTSNAGLGWVVTMGDLYQPHNLGEFVLDDAPWAWPNGSRKDWLYVAPDGSRIEFSCDPNYPTGDCDAAQPTRFFSSGYRMRLRRLGADNFELDMPNGEIHAFEEINWNGCWQGDRCWRLTGIRDGWSNWVELAYSSATNQITITDSRGREHHIKYQVSPGDNNIYLGDMDPTTGWGYQSYSHVVDYVDLNTQSGDLQRYDFSYESKLLNRAGPYNFFSGEPYDDDHSFPFLTSISVPLKNSFWFNYDEDHALDPGILTGYGVPSGGYVNFFYESWYLPRSCNSSPYQAGVSGTYMFDNEGLPAKYTVFPGVKTRLETDPFGPEGESTATTSYYQQISGVYSGRFGDATCDRPYAMKVVKDNPAGANGRHIRETKWFSIEQDDAASVWRPREFGLQMKKDTSVTGKSGNKVYLSSQVDSCSGSSCTPLRKTYRRYAMVMADPAAFCESGDPVTCSRRDSQLVEEYIDYLDDTSVSRSTVYSDYDGLGHMRRVTTYTDGYPGSSAPQVTYTNWNSWSDNVTVGESIISLGSGFFSDIYNEPWIHAQYASRSISGNGTTETKSYCWNSNQIGGILTHAETSSKHLRQTFKFYTTGQPSLATLQQSSSLSGTCAADLNAPIKRSLGYAWNSELNYAKFDALAEVDVSRVFDLNGNLASSTDPSGVVTDFIFDRVGRLTRSKVGELDSINVSYTNPSVTSNSATAAYAIITQGDITAKVYFDGFGRPFKEEFSHPGGSKTTEIYIDALGNTYKLQLNGDGDSEAAWDHDVFGRVTSATRIDGSTLSYSYIGDRQMTRTASVGSSNTQSVVTRYDGSGRVFSVDNGEHCTWSSYDNAGRLVSSKRASLCEKSSGVQTRSWSYDARGFLLSTSTPEGGTIVYSDHDLNGNPGKVAGPVHELAKSFDVKGRLLEVRRDTSSTVDPLLVEYSFVGGKLASQIRHNWLDGSDYKVKHEFTYDGLGGALSDSTIHVDYPDANGNPKKRSFVQNYTHTSQGSPESLSYPDCLSGTCSPHRMALAQYVNNHLTGIVWRGATSSDTRNLASVSYNEYGVIDEISFPGINQFKTAYDQKSSGVQLDKVRVSDGQYWIWDTGSYVYNELGSITSIGSETLRYDDALRLTESRLHGITQTFEYDAYDNMIRKDGLSQAADSRTNRLTGAEYDYDAAGNMVSDGCFDYDYDALNVVRSITPADPSRPECNFSVRHLYDASNLRVLSMCVGCTPDAGPPAPVFDFVADPAVVHEGEWSTLTWSNVVDADECISEWSPNTHRSTAGGSEEVLPYYTTSYTMTCSNDFGSTSRTVEVEVVDRPPPPQFRFSVSPEAIDYGASATLRWSDIDESATSCYAVKGFSGDLPINGGSGGTQVVSPTEDTVYEMACENSEGVSASRFAVVDVIEPPTAHSHIRVFDDSGSPVLNDSTYSLGSSEPDMAETRGFIVANMSDDSIVVRASTLKAFGPNTHSTEYNLRFHQRRLGPGESADFSITRLPTRETASTKLVQPPLDQRTDALVGFSVKRVDGTPLAPFQFTVSGGVGDALTHYCEGMTMYYGVQCPAEASDAEFLRLDMPPGRWGPDIHTWNFLNFGTVPIGEERIYRLEGRWTGPLQFKPEFDVYSNDGNFLTSIEKEGEWWNDSADVRTASVTFRPTGPGRQYGRARLWTGGSRNFEVMGFAGDGAGLRVQYEPSADWQVTAIQGLPVTFDQPRGRTQRVLRIFNDGNRYLEAAFGTPNGSGSFQFTPNSVYVAPGSEAVVVVDFLPVHDFAEYAETLHVSHNAPNVDSPLRLALRGRAASGPDPADVTTTHQAPGIVEAEWVSGGESVGFGGGMSSPDKTSLGGEPAGLNVGYAGTRLVLQGLQSGSWQKYDFGANAAGTYDLVVTYATTDATQGVDGEIEVSIDGSPRTLSLPSTGQHSLYFSEAVMGGIVLAAGDHELVVTHLFANHLIDRYELRLQPGTVLTAYPDEIIHRETEAYYVVLASRLTANDLPSSGVTLVEPVAGFNPSAGVVAFDYGYTIPALRITPPVNFSGGRLTFEYAMTDGVNRSNATTVTLDIPLDLGALEAVPDTIDLGLERKSSYLLETALLLDDESEAGAYVAEITQPDDGGVIQLGQAAEPAYFRYYPSPDFPGGDVHFTYRITRDGATFSNAATVTLRVPMLPLRAVDDHIDLGSVRESSYLLETAWLLDDPSEFGAYVVSVTQPTDGGRMVLGQAERPAFMRYYPDAEFPGGQAQFQYEITRDGLAFSTGTVTMVVPERMVTLIANPDSVSFDAYSSSHYVNVPSLLLGNDVPGHPEVWVDAASGLGQPTVGTIIEVVGSVPQILQYSPPSGFDGGIVEFSYRTTDGESNSNWATVSLDVPAESVELVATPNSIQFDTPAARYYINAPGELLHDDLPGHPDVWVDAQALGQPALGSIVEVVGSVPQMLQYTPPTSFEGGEVTFGYRTTNGTQSSNVAQVTLTLPASAPVANADGPFSTPHATTLTLSSVVLMANDTAAGAVIDDFQAFPAHGSVTLDTDGNVLYVPATGYSGPDSFTYRLRDQQGNHSNAAAVQIVVLPVAVPDGPFSVTCDQPLPIPRSTLLSNDGGTGLVIHSFPALPTHGTLLTASTAEVIYQPTSVQPAYEGADSFAYRVRDAAGKVSGVVTVDLDIRCPQDAVLDLEDLQKLLVILGND